MKTRQQPAHSIRPRSYSVLRMLAVGVAIGACGLSNAKAAPEFELAAPFRTTIGSQALEFPTGQRVSILSSDAKTVVARVVLPNGSMTIIQVPRDKIRPVDTTLARQTISQPTPAAAASTPAPATTKAAAVIPASNPATTAQISEPGAINGIALSTHRPGGSDSGVGVGPALFGNIIRHTIKNGKVVASDVLYSGKGRCAVINQNGTMVAFLQLNGKIQVINMDGTNLRELPNAVNHNASWLAWPNGDWIYYSEQGRWPTGDWFRGESKAPETRTIHRINVTGGEDEVVGNAKEGIWQLSLAANATKGSGKFTIVGWIGDLANPSEPINDKVLACGTGVSCNGRYVTEMLDTHAEMRIYEWPLTQVMTTFKVNQFTRNPDGRVSMYRPRWSVNSDAWIVATQGADFGCTKQTNAALYNWRDKQQIQLTNNNLSSTESDEGDAFWLEGVANDFAGSGLTEGEVPFTTSLGKGMLQGSWAWDFGDGARGNGPEGRHTYATPGVYTVTATQGNRTLKQSVTALENRPPNVIQVDALDDRHLTFTFDKPVDVANGASMKLASGVASTSVAAQAASSKVLAEWAAPIPAGGTVTITGVQDRNQVPNRLKNPTVPYTLPEWPNNRSKLAWVYQTKKSRNFIYNPVIKTDVECSVFVWDGLSKYTRDGAMPCGGPTSFTATPAVDKRYPFCSVAHLLGEMSKESGAFSLEMVVQPADITQSNTILGLSQIGFTNFELRQDGENISLGFHNQKPVPIGKFDGVRQQHLTITCAEGKVLLYIDGKQSGEPQQFGDKQKTSLEGMGYLTFGHLSTNSRGRAWKGTLEGIAFYGRALPADEILKDSQIYRNILSQRRTVPAYDVQAELVASSSVTSVADVAPYDNALIVNEYKVVSAQDRAIFPAGKSIRVAQWGVVQKQVAPVNKLQAGAKVTLHLEKLSDNPQLESIFLRDKLTPDFDAVVYYEAKE